MIKTEIGVNKRKNKFVYLMFLVFLGLHIYFALQTVSSGAKLSSLENKEKGLISANRELTSSLIKLSSLVKVQESSSLLGFAKPGQLLYLNGEETVAQAGLSNY
jgi:hypothetical protein